MRFNLMLNGACSNLFSKPDLMMRFGWQLLAVVGFISAAPPLAAPPDGTRPVVPVATAPEHEEPDIDMYALMSGKCTTLKIAGSDFACKAVAYFHSQQGRAHFTIVLDDPRDASHIISFSGENGRRDQDNVYDLQVDKILPNSKARPRVD